MCCGERQGHQSAIVTQGAGQSGMRETCGCEERHGHHDMHMSHKMHHSEDHGSCCCKEGKQLSKEERIKMLEEHRELLKCEMNWVEEELNEIKRES